MNCKVGIIVFLTFLSSTFCDLLGQNRLGNNLHLFKMNRHDASFGNFYMMSMMAEMAKTKSGRSVLKTFMKTVPTRKTYFRGRIRQI